jgi:hypothetical protein
MRGYIITTLIAIAVCAALLSNIAAAEIYEAAKVPGVAPMVEIVIDGDLSEWCGNPIPWPPWPWPWPWPPPPPPPPILLLGEETWEANGGNWDGEDDLSMLVEIMWDSDNLYIGSVVNDDVHMNVQTGGSIWNGDGVQYMIDPTGNRTETSDVVYEFGYSLAGANSDEPTEWRWLQNASAPAAFESEFAIVRRGGMTIYEVRLPKEQIAPAELVEGNTLGFGVIANDGDPDAEGQAGWVGWGSGGIVFGKDATQLEEVVLTGVITSVQSSGKLTTTWGGLKK